MFALAPVQIEQSDCCQKVTIYKPAFFCAASDKDAFLKDVHHVTHHTIEADECLCIYFHFLLIMTIFFLQE